MAWRACRVGQEGGANPQIRKSVGGRGRELHGWALGSSEFIEEGGPIAQSVNQLQIGGYRWIGVLV